MMIRKAEECNVEYREHMRGGDGTVEITNFISGSAELYEKGRLFSKITLKPGTGIGYHEHEGDSELFYFLDGPLEYSDNGTIVTVNAGDVAICPAGTSHAVTNRTNETKEFIALIVYA
jgi:quercetin dioxygenase-like cupin family protein